MSKWTKNTGVRPVPEGTLVDVEYLDGERSYGATAMESLYSDCGRYASDWETDPSPATILKWRLHKPLKNWEVESELFKNLCAVYYKATAYKLMRKIRKYTKALKGKEGYKADVGGVGPLTSYFVFEETKEGFDFWWDVHFKLVSKITKEGK